MEPYWNVDPDSPEAAKLPFPVIEDFFFVARGRQVFMGLRAHDPMRAKELEPLVFSIGMGLPGAMAVAKQSSIFEQGLSAGRTVDVEITGPDVTKLVGLGGQVLGQVMPLLSTPDAPAKRFPQPSLDLSSPEVHIEPKLVQAADMRINTTDLGFTANALIDGAYVSDYYLDGKKIDLTVMGEDRYAKHDAGHRGAADRHADGPARAALGRGRRASSPAAPSRSTTASASGRSRFKSRRPPTCRSKTRCTRFRDQIVAADHRRRPARRRLSHRPGRHGRQAPRGLAGAAIQRPAGLHHHLPADGRAVRVVALSVRDHSHRAARRRRRRAWVCGC